MQPDTLRLVRGLLQSDTSIDDATRNRMLAGLRNGEKTGAKSLERRPGIIKRREVAGMLSCSLRTVDNMAAEGILQRVKYPGRVRGGGFRRADVEALINGGNHE